MYTAPIFPDAEGMEGDNSNKQKNDREYGNSLLMSCYKG